MEKFAPESFVKKGVAAIPEGRGIFPNLSVKENIWMWTFQGGVGKEEAEQRTYERFPKLKERRAQQAGTLSGGEQQMLAIARVVVGSPQLVLFDELSMGLAPLVVEELYAFVGELANEGITIIVVEQFVTTVLSLATEAAIILHGKVHAMGTPEEMASAALDAYLATGAKS
jgi:branched-chain amino acid transport system ATP-binding protein